MIIAVKVVPRSSQKKVVHNKREFKVYVHEAAIDGKANDAMRVLLADHFHVPKSYITIMKGHTSRNKIIEINPVRKQRP